MCLYCEYVIFDFEFSGFVFDFEFFVFVFDFEFFVFVFNFEFFIFEFSILNFLGKKKPRIFCFFLFFKKPIAAFSDAA